MALPAAVPAVALRDVTLDDKYELGTGRVFLTGVGGRGGRRVVASPRGPAPGRGARGGV
jgi:hypothetical protein